MTNANLRIKCKVALFSKNEERSLTSLRLYTSNTDITVKENSNKIN